MIESYYLDPYCLRIKTTDESIVLKSIEFFNLIINKLSDGKISIILDQYFRSAIIEREQIPFPIDSGCTENPKMIRDINLINTAFVNIVSNNLTYREIDDCYGDQNFITNINSEIYIDGYEELLRTILMECYNKKITAEKILINDSFTKISQETVCLTCSCDKETFDKNFQVCRISDLIDNKEISKSKLKECIVNGVKDNNPEIVQGTQHHCVIGNHNIDVFSDIPRTHKKVVALLRHFGLFKIHFLDFVRLNGEIGSIRNCKVLKNDSEIDIVEGYLISEDRTAVKVHLYLSMGIGRDLIEVFGKNLKYRDLVDFINPYVTN